jgi:hypothetical protein
VEALVPGIWRVDLSTIFVAEGGMLSGLSTFQVWS